MEFENVELSNVSTYDESSGFIVVLDRSTFQTFTEAKVRYERREKFCHDHFDARNEMTW